MTEEKAAFGEALIAHYLPTVAAQRYLNCCTVAGWHRCNELYHLRYEQGSSQVFVLFTVKGKGWIRAGGRHFTLKEGSLAIFRAGIPMEYGTDTDEKRPLWEFYWLNLDGDYVHRLAIHLWEDGCAVHNCSQPSRYLPLFRSLMDENAVNREQERRRSDNVQEICDLLLDECFFAGAPTVDQRVDGILRYLQDHYTQSIALSDLSEHFYVSSNHLIRIFHTYTGYTPYEYLKRYRLLKACELLQGTVVPIQDVGRQLGYRNNSHFAAQFRDLYGVSPREYRRLFAVTPASIERGDDEC